MKSSNGKSKKIDPKKAMSGTYGTMGYNHLGPQKQGAKNPKKMPPTYDVGRSTLP